ncbi:hypothetical protein LX16_0802 [Stackebrandtia albiflava]|uniref:Uncharacterized protein n=1 Tax=Stackebrandtia albiflava TaxID=406432 RepID=A0A562VB60_9ACTN|nr:hypothetical protein [Stackebrandtia albiflava]TWJ15104.1 hypothetical protein LX16_0802 [Stackebrandtia albiflava]
MNDTHDLTEDHEPPQSDTDATEEQPEPMNRAERRAAKRNKGKNKVKGVQHGVDRSGFTPKDVKIAGHKEFTNRKSG